MGAHLGGVEAGVLGGALDDLERVVVGHRLAEAALALAQVQEDLGRYEHSGIDQLPLDGAALVVEVLLQQAPRALRQDADAPLALAPALAAEQLQCALVGAVEVDLGGEDLVDAKAVEREGEDRLVAVGAEVAEDGVDLLVRVPLLVVHRRLAADKGRLGDIARRRGHDSLAVEEGVRVLPASLLCDLHLGFSALRAQEGVEAGHDRVVAPDGEAGPLSLHCADERDDVAELQEAQEAGEVLGGRIGVADVPAVLQVVEVLAQLVGVLPRRLGRAHAHLVEELVRPEGVGVRMVDDPAVHRVPVCSRVEASLNGKHFSPDQTSIHRTTLSLTE